MTATERIRAAYRARIDAEAAARKRVEAQCDLVAEIADERLAAMAEIDAAEEPDAATVERFAALDRDHVRGQILRLVGRRSTPLLDRYAEQEARYHIGQPIPPDLPPLDDDRAWARLADDVLGR